MNKQKKRLEETKESIISSGREEVIEKVNKEISFLEEYLPKPLNDVELLGIIEKKILETQASSLKDMGRVMKEVLKEVGLRADSKKISELVKHRLSNAHSIK